MTLANVAFTASIGVGSLALARTWASDTGLLVAFAVVHVAALGLGVAVPLRTFLVRQQHAATEREDALVAENERRELDARVSRALDMAEDESAALAIAGRALGELATGMRGVVLVADSSRAHLSVAARTDDDPVACCSVATPFGCPAVRSGHARRFEDSSRLDACPHLVGRSDHPISAVCVPVSIMGRASGVVHAVTAVADAPDRNVVARLEIVARHTGARVGMLRAMSQSMLQANTDALTGLRNRRSTENEVRALVRNGTPFAIGIADLDHFKHLNDTHGHDTGDRALRTFAQVLKRTVRDSDIVSRHGGEEFVVVFPHASAAAAAAVFDRVRLELAATLSDGRIPAFTCSVGIVDTCDGEEFDDLLDKADRLLLEAKRSGRDRVVVRPSASVSDASPAL